MSDVERASDSVDRTDSPLPRSEYFGWTMFGLSGLLFLINGARTGDWITVVASAMWIVGCVAFLRRT